MIDPHSETWHAVNEWIEFQETLALNQLRQPGLSMENTESIRGRLGALDDLRGLVALRPTSAVPIMT